MRGSVADVINMLIQKLIKLHSNFFV